MEPSKVLTDLFRDELKQLLSTESESGKYATEILAIVEAGDE